MKRTTILIADDEVEIADLIALIWKKRATVLSKYRMGERLCRRFNLIRLIWRF